MDAKWIVLPFLFLMSSVVFISAWFPEWPIQWGNYLRPRGRGYPASFAGKIAFGSFGMLMALSVAIDGIQPRYCRYIEMVVLLVLFVIGISLAVGDKQKFDSKKSQD
jgi:hypothetical protein